MCLFSQNTEAGTIDVFLDKLLDTFSVNQLINQLIASQLI